MSVPSHKQSSHYNTDSTPVICAKHVLKMVEMGNEVLRILDGIDLNIYQGETVAIIGSSGAGKSTLMTILAGLLTPSEGEVYLFDHPLHLLNDEKRAALRRDLLSFVFQNFLLVPTLTALENVTLPCLLRGETEDILRAKMLLDSVGLSKRIDHTPDQLSGGEQQRVALARAFMIKPKILFADEPTGNLDQVTAHNIIEQLFSLNQTNQTTLVLVTHDQQLANRCQRVIQMKAGRILESL